MKFYRCDICGNFVEMVKASGAPMTCCGQKMTEIIPGTSDGAVEKHVPVYSLDDNILKVNVGSIDHPMVEAHHIEWVAVETDKGAYRIMLSPDNAPRIELALSDGEKVVNVYAYCNLHGLWKAE